MDSGSSSLAREVASGRREEKIPELLCSCSSMDASGLHVGTQVKTGASENHRRTESRPQETVDEISADALSQ